MKHDNERKVEEPGLNPVVPVELFDIQNDLLFPDLIDNSFVWHSVCFWLHLSCPSSPRPRGTMFSPFNLFSHGHS